VSAKQEKQVSPPKSDDMILWAVDRYGTSFEKAVIETFRKADSNNKIRVRAAFLEIWEKYMDDRWYSLFSNKDIAD
jgi:hypothetical protein